MFFVFCLFFFGGKILNYKLNFIDWHRTIQINYFFFRNSFGMLWLLSPQFVVMAPPSFLILVICVFFLPFLISITRGLIIFSDLFKEPTFYYIEKFFLVSILLIFASVEYSVIWIISIFYVGNGLCCHPFMLLLLCFPNFSLQQRCNTHFCIWGNI